MIRCISFAQNFLLVISIILPISLILYDHIEYDAKIAEIAQKYHKLQLHKNDLIEELLKVQERRIDRAKELQALDGEKWERDKLEWKQWKHENLGVKKEEKNSEKGHENPLPPSTNEIPERPDYTSSKYKNLPTLGCLMPDFFKAGVMAS